MKNLIKIFVLLLFFPLAGSAQPFKGGASFIDFQKTFPRPEESFRRKEDTLQKQFAEKKLAWPAKYIYLRSFKYDSKLEVWVKNDLKEAYQLFKTYRVCALAGSLGPKRLEGDYQVPEGFYYINEFNPRSSYYLSLGLNYPNLSDMVLSDSLRPGGDIYIHGSCVTVGCIPMTDQQIDELYILAAHAKNQGQDYIPVHIFPIRYDVPKSVNYLKGLTKDDPELKKFTDRLEEAFDYFEKYKQVPIIMIDDDGEYFVNGVIARDKQVKENARPVKRPAPVRRTRNVGTLAEAVHKWPQFPGGGDAFMKYLDKLGKEMIAYLPTGVKKQFVQVEFIVDKDGVPVNFKILKGSEDEDLAEELITRLEKMPHWTPAVLHDQPVAKKMIQTVTIGVE
jgi:murein L,D-transpeptidase YafK